MKVRIKRMMAMEKIILEQLKDMLAKRFRLHKLIVFGSRARGDADPDSDLDIVVILEDAPTEAERDYVSDCAWEAGLEHGIVIVPFVFDRGYWEKGPIRHSLFAKAVREEGVPV